MSVAMYAYDPDRCDGNPCPMECTWCSRNPENGFDDGKEEDEDD